MPYINDLLRLSQQDERQYTYVGNNLGLPEGAAYASFYPQWEVSSPQYVTPNPYSLAQLGYRTNELVFTCINVRADSVAEAPLWVLDDSGETPEEIKKHKIRDLLKNPCPGIGEQTFWKIVETYLGIAGFSAWEKERNNLGEVIRLWPMRPDWCSFLRGQQKPVRAIRYQPNGLPPMDIAIEDIVLFAYFDPLYPLLKPFSPTMSALNMIDVDNNMTLMINTFLKNGAFLGGILSTENQVLQEAEAEVYKARWRAVHGGSKNAGDIAVLGKGLNFKSTNNTFREMVFPEVDARSEARITMVFRVPPMLIGAKLGLDRSTYSNYQEARKGFYEGPIANEWKFLSAIVEDQLLPDFEENVTNFTCAFSTREVKALQEDRTARVDRADKMFKGKWAKLNEAREEAGLDPVDGEEGEAFYSEPVPEPEPMNGKEPAEGEAETEETEETEQEQPKTQEEIDLEDGEEKKYKAFAKRRIKEAKFDDLKEYEFKYLSPVRQAELIKEYTTLAVLYTLKEAVSE